MRPWAAVPTGLALTGLTVIAGCAGNATIGERVFDHFSRAGQIPTALISGDLEAARRPASWLADHEGFEDLGPDAEPWVARIRTEARAVADAPSLDAAADATGRLAAACADCHAAPDGAPRFRSAAAAPPVLTRGAHMMGHLWAMDRMWEGLVGGSDETWRAGARAISDVEPEGFPGGGPAILLARSVHEQASDAAGLEPAARPAAYAELVKTCASCHTLTGVAGQQ